MQVIWMMYKEVFSQIIFLNNKYIHLLGDKTVCLALLCSLGKEWAP